MKKIVPSNAILIPDNAIRAFQGQIFDIYQWPQTMFDGTTATFELLKRPDTVQVILVKGDQILLVNDEQPGRTTRTHFPGGRTDDDDVSWQAAAIRELKEETGITADNWRLIDVVQPIPKIEWFAPWFLVTDVTEEGAQLVDIAGEKISLEWKGFQEIRDMVLSGTEPTLQYAAGIFLRSKTLDELLALPKFEGKEVNR